MTPLEDWKGIPLEQLLGYQALDQDHTRIGVLRCLWSTPNRNEIKVLGVQTAWIYKRRLLVPARGVTLDETAKTLALPYLGIFIKEGPSIPMETELIGLYEADVWRHYGIEGRSMTMEGGAAEKDSPTLVFTCYTFGQKEAPVGSRRGMAHSVSDARSPMDAVGSSEAKAAHPATSGLPKADDPATNTGELDSRTVGAQVGAIGASLAGAAFGGVVAGPLGMPVGAVIGAVLGGFTGRSLADTFVPTDEEARWRANLRKTAYFQEGYDYSDYEPAFRVGYEGYRQSTISGCGFDESEADLRRDFEQTKGASRLSWEDAKAAVRDAWVRAETRAAANKLE